MRLLVTGAKGFLGSYLLDLARSRQLDVVGTSRTSDDPLLAVDLCDSTSVRRLFRSVSPTHVVNTAAMADGGKCMKAPSDAYAINAGIPETLANACAGEGVRLLHVSTDLVFDGERAPYAEDDEAAPGSTYGQSKLEGEELALSILSDALVVRLPLLFGSSPERRRGASDMLVCARDDAREVCLFEDEYRSPLHASDAASAILKSASADLTGRLHIASTESISRYDLGLLIARRVGLEPARIRPGRRSDFHSAEPRPRDVTLDVSQALSHGIELPSVAESVAKL